MDLGVGGGWSLVGGVEWRRCSRYRSNDRRTRNKSGKEGKASKGEGRWRKPSLRREGKKGQLGCKRKESISSARYVAMYATRGIAIRDMYYIRFNDSLSLSNLI